MLNFTHIPCITDGQNAVKIAKKMKEMSKIKENKLENLLTRRFNTKKSVGTELSSIEDFPKLKKEEIQNEILFGSFQLRQSQSYLSDLIENGKAYIIEEPSLTSRKQKKDVVSKCKTIGFEITSRHKRSEIKDIKKQIQKSFAQFTKFL